MSEQAEEGTSEATRRGRTARAPGRRPLTEGDADDTRQTIRRHAIRLFNERGYASVSMDDIAESAELTRATLYYHYRGKADIFVESVTDMLGYVHAEVMRVLNQREWTVKERLGKFVSGRREGHLPDFEAEVGEDISEAMVYDAIPHLSPRQKAKVTQSMEALHDATRALLTEGVANGELRPLPIAVLDYLFWQVFQPESYPTGMEMPRTEWESHLMDVFLRGVGG
ncbi:MAG: TetR/AcrR family transcriptional regulator [Fibrella sp.]|nr:TetR/AcrR family transcriptional regulator [Armatimonadota bacterium]